MTNIVVIVATKGRRQEVDDLLHRLEKQTRAPDQIIISACDPSDIGLFRPKGIRTDCVFGGAGVSNQRNRGLATIHGKADIVIFFDDDFIPSRFWIARVQELLSLRRDVVCVTGQVLQDGVKIGGIDRSVGFSLVEETDRTEMPSLPLDYVIKIRRSPYGCNMAFRGNLVEDLLFDERLALYCWLEDYDFGIRAAKRGQVIWTSAVWGVHLGSKKSRVPGVAFGYSQVVNPWYLHKKGSMRNYETAAYIIRCVTANVIGSIMFDQQVDRLGRLKGNVLGLGDLVSRRWRPEKAGDLR